MILFKEVDRSNYMECIDLKIKKEQRYKEKQMKIEL